MTHEKATRPPGGSAGEAPVWPSQTKIRQDQIQQACLKTISLTEAAKEDLPPETRLALEEQLAELIQTQQDLENELGRLQIEGQDLTYLWWQVAELETLVFAFHKTLKGS